ncbi:CIA30 family protein [Coleophoma crateriformis]|uniref:CIA30 family protein n=1 Tax=Coleophoma crateriformis TaxID=565419 RepID=A0A3D8RCW9_9HELO|nr:CIA30 family protein [Coleophoma crateriformis]
MPSSTHTRDLFGGDQPWSSSDWTDSDDRVRGGHSQSHLTITPTQPTTAVFQGNLDIKTLGGAGFASQRTTGEDRVWDLSPYDGLLLDLDAADTKRYTVTLKDELLPKSSNGREQSTVSWEYDFTVDPNATGGLLFVPWKDFSPTYRGREKNDAKPLDLKNIKRFSLMMRR